MGEATRAAAARRDLSRRSQSGLTDGNESEQGKSENSMEEKVPEQYQDFPIGHKRRRPRWGVPVRFDIREIEAKKIKLCILDLLLMDAHKEKADRTNLKVEKITIERSRLERGDPRRSGATDGVRGVYLGELVWVLIAEVVQLVVVNSPSGLFKTAVLAAGYAMKDMGIRVGARAAARWLLQRRSSVLSVHDA